MSAVMNTSDTRRKLSRSRKNHLDTREECKKALAAHISKYHIIAKLHHAYHPADDQLGLSIGLDQISLQNPQEHGYFWVFQNKFIAKHFSKTLSSLNMAACKQLSQEVGYTFKAIPTSTVVQGPNFDYTLTQWPNMAPSTPGFDNNIPRTKAEGKNHAVGTFSDPLSGEQELNILKLQLKELNSQHECVMRQLQDSRMNLQAAVERNDRYDSFILGAFLRMDDVERTIESLREDWFNALEGSISVHNTEICQDRDC